MSYYSTLFKSARKVAKKTSSNIADLGTNFFKRSTRKVSSTASNARKSATSIKTSGTKSSATTKPKTTGARGITPEPKGVKSVGGVLQGKNARRLLAGAAVGGGAALLGTGIARGAGAVKDVFDPAARNIKNTQEYFDTLQDAKDKGLLPTGYGFDSGDSLNDYSDFLPEADSKPRTGLILAGLAAAGVGAYFLLKKKKSSKKKSSGKKGAKK
jgi:LPXTG-motif cell wall-anchored protein